MAEYHLTTPVSEEDVRKLKAGDTIYLSGTVFTARDEAHMELIAHKGIPGFDMTGLGLYHCGPVMKKIPVQGGEKEGKKKEEMVRQDSEKEKEREGERKGEMEKNDVKMEGGNGEELNEKWVVVSAGPTTSFRMETLEPGFLDLFDVKVIIGKGGMGPLTLEALRKHTAVYVSFTGGAGALAAKGLGEVKDVHYLEELGMPEAVWVFEARKFGPLVVSMDSHGNSLYVDVNAETEKNLQRILKSKGLA